jgi:predicted dehydrogenase/threonine dehydrogenase-like Zn-dependent dehydrogenase
VRVIDVPRPVSGPTEVLVQTIASVISPGTERAVTELARSNLLAKAVARPDLVREVVARARTEGIAQTARKIRSRLGADIPLGYSAAGIALEVGEYVTGVAPGQLVATGGAGKANHAEFQAVPGLLCVPVPKGVTAEDAAFGTVGSIALHALRLAETGPGSKVVVIGLGLVGQLAARIARAAGCDVAGIDVDDFPVERANTAGVMALVESGEDTTAAVLDWSRGRGADAVLVTASGSSSQMIRRTAALCRDRAQVVVVGDVGLDLERRPFYEKELTLRFARSYGPGRYEMSYEDWGVDYPPGQVRWSEGRNLEAVLDLMAAGRLRVDDLVTQRFGISDAGAAFRLVESRAEPYLGVVFSCQRERDRERPIVLRAPRRVGGLGVGLIGAGAFASGTLMPAFRAAGFERFVAAASASGLAARTVAERFGFERAVSGPDAVIEDPDVEVVVVATPHVSHAELAGRALRSGKHVFCEKPLGLTIEELDDVEAAWRESGRVLFVGFNRRYSPAIGRVRSHFGGRSGPLVVTYRVNAGPIPKGHWYHDRRQGGRLIGEVCHFVDTCNAIVGLDAADVEGVGSHGTDATASDDLALALGYHDGSIASIAYASGGPSWTDKEHIEVWGRGRSAAVRDFREVWLDRDLKKSAQDKGHKAAIGHFRNALLGMIEAPSPFEASRTTLLVAATLGASARIESAGVLT